MTFVVHVNDNTPRATALSATATVTSDTPDPDPSNNTIFATAAVPGAITETDLAIAASVTPASVPRGQLLTFDLTVSNLGQIAATNVIMTMETPSQTTFEALSAPGGWQTQTPDSGISDIIEASIPSIDAGATAHFIVTVRVNSDAPIGSTILGDATIACETIDTNQANNRANASATVAEADVSGVAGINVAISGSVNPAAVGQDLTYTITVTNPGNQAATGAAAHVTVPNTVLIVSMGGGSPTSSGVDFQVGSLSAGETRQFQVVVRPENPGTITVTAAVSADSGVSLGSPASVATDVVGAASGGPTPPAVLSAVRYGFHQQATILVVTYDKPMNPATASNTKNYLVLDSSHGTAHTVPISRVSYNAQSHQATLRVARHIYLFRPWRLVIRGEVTDMSGVSLLSDGVAGHGFATQMDSRSLGGPAWDAPQASRVGVKPAHSRAARCLGRESGPQGQVAAGQTRQVRRDNCIIQGIERRNCSPGHERPGHKGNPNQSPHCFARVENHSEQEGPGRRAGLTSRILPLQTCCSRDQEFSSGASRPIWPAPGGEDLAQRRTFVGFKGDLGC